MIASLSPHPLGGSVSAVGSKSDIHRLLICAAMSDRATRITGITPCQDVLATAGCIRAMGASIEANGGEWLITPGKPKNKPVFDCGESGSTLRFLLPCAVRRCGGGTFIGSGRLPMRPLGDLIQAMTSGGAVFSSDRLPLTVKGGLRPGTYELPGNVSSQYISGLLMALSVTPGRSEIRLTTKLESAKYVDMTLDTLRLFGADITRGEGAYIINGRGELTSPGTAAADGDWSNAAFFLVSGAIHGSVTVSGLRLDSLQGDKEIVKILRDFGANVAVYGDSVTVTPAKLVGKQIDLTHIPDLLPALAILASFSEGDTVFTGAERLRIKESDRLKTVCNMINALGGRAVEHPGGLTVTGGGLTGGNVDGANDHRIVMAAAVGASHCTNNVRIIGCEAVNKSYPEFFEHLKLLGGVCDVV